MTHTQARLQVLDAILTALDRLNFADVKADKYFKHEIAQLEKKVMNVEKKVKNNANKPF